MTIYIKVIKSIISVRGHKARLSMLFTSYFHEKPSIIYKKNIISKCKIAANLHRTKSVSQLKAVNSKMVSFSNPIHL